VGGGSEGDQRGNGRGGGLKGKMEGGGRVGRGGLGGRAHSTLELEVLAPTPRAATYRLKEKTHLLHYRTTSE
jgi:hypothetical protein